MGVGWLAKVYEYLCGIMFLSRNFFFLGDDSAMTWIIAFSVFIGVVIIAIIAIIAGMSKSELVNKGIMITVQITSNLASAC